MQEIHRLYKERKIGEKHSKQLDINRFNFKRFGLSKREREILNVRIFGEKFQLEDIMKRAYKTVKDTTSVLRYMTPGIFNKNRDIEEIEFYHDVGGKKIKAMIYKPKGEVGQKYPLIPFDIGLGYRMWDVQFLSKPMARMGFAVYGTEYRRAEIAKGEIEDIINGMDIIREKFDFISDETLLFGVSMGAAIMLHIATRPEVVSRHNIQKVIALAGFSDLVRMYYYATNYVNTHDENDPRRKLLRKYLKCSMGMTPGEYPDEYYLRSPINYLHKINLPVTFIHGVDDEIVPADHSIEMYKKMKKLKKDVKLHLTLGEGIHTPFEELFNDLTNFIGFCESIIHIYRFMNNIEDPDLITDTLRANDYLSNHLFCPQNVSLSPSLSSSILKP